MRRALLLLALPPLALAGPARGQDGPQLQIAASLFAQFPVGLAQSVVFERALGDAGYVGAAEVPDGLYGDPPALKLGFYLGYLMEPRDAPAYERYRGYSEVWVRLENDSPEPYTFEVPLFLQLHGFASGRGSEFFVRGFYGLSGDGGAASEALFPLYGVVRWPGSILAYPLELSETYDTGLRITLPGASDAPAVARLHLGVDGWMQAAMLTPEPASLALLGTGLVGLVAVRRRRKA